MKTIQHTSTLFSYDGPQVFEARDATGGQYIAVAVQARNGLDRYLVTGVGAGTVTPIPRRHTRFAVVTGRGRNRGMVSDNLGGWSGSTLGARASAHVY